MKSIGFALGLALVTASALAARAPDGPAPNCEGLKVATGPAGKGYSKLFADLKKVSKGSPALCEVTTEGGLDNLTTLSTKGADVGIVPIDTLRQMAKGDDNIASLQVVATLNSNFLHVVTAADGITYAGEKKYFGLSEGAARTVRITRFSELKGQPVAAVGSAQLLVRQLDKELTYGMHIVDVDTDAKAFEMVKSGQVLAALTVAGWPHGAVQALKQDSKLSLVPFDAPLAKLAYTVRPFSYKNLGVYNVQALSVQNVLVTRAFTGAKIQEVAALKRLIKDRLAELKDGEFEPGWNEIKSLDTPLAWAVFAGGAAKPVKK